MATRKLTDEEKRKLYRDGFLILRKAVPENMVENARRHLNVHMGAMRGQAMSAKKIDPVRQNAVATVDGTNPVFTELYNKSGLKALVTSVIGGPLPDAMGAQVASVYPGRHRDSINEAGYRDGDTPFHGWCGHLDGLWNGAGPVPAIERPMTRTERKKWYQDPARNGCSRSYEGTGMNITNFTALVGVALSDQRKEGVGNLGLLKGAHLKMGEFFRWQDAQGGPLGPDGPGWPREHFEAPNGHGLRHYPDQLRDAYKRSAEVTPDGRLWPKPTLMKLAPGDAVIVHFATPHSASRVDGPDPRHMIYFRVMSPDRPEDQRRSYSPALTDIWKEWKGMRRTVKEMASA